MRVVVTGASGNVGTSVLAALAADEQVEEIVAIARRSPGVAFAKTRWLALDVLRADLASAFSGADAVIHLAWLIQPSRDERVTHAVNVDGSARVFEAVAAAGVGTLVYASSVGAYAPHPDDTPVDESWPTTGIPSSFYSRHKAEVERLLDRFQQQHPAVRSVRLRPSLIFKREAASEIRRLFMGPFLPGSLARPGIVPVLPLPRGLRVQAVHSLDVGRAYALAATKPVRGAFNIAAEPVLDRSTLARVLRARPLELPPRLVRALVDASWRARLQPSSPGWLDMGLNAPLLDCSRARDELGWRPRFEAVPTLEELLAGLRAGDGLATPPLQAGGAGPLRWRELRSGVGARVG